MRKALGLWSAAALAAVSLTACGGGTRYDAADNRGAVTDDGTLTGETGATDFGDTTRKRNDSGATDNGGVTYDSGTTYRTDDRSMWEEASDALENGTRRARDALENAGDAIRDGADNRTGS